MTDPKGKAEFILSIVGGLMVEPIYLARALHGYMECKMPYPLWLHHEVTSMFDEGDDYAFEIRDGRRECRLTMDTTHLVAMRQPTPVGMWIRHIMAKALSERGPLSTMSFEEMMREAERYSDETHRLKLLMRDVPEGSR